MDRDHKEALARFLKQHCLTEEEFKKAGYSWKDILEICADHRNHVQDLRSTGEYVVRRLQGAPDIHSLKMRVKDADHLAAKIVRKRLVDPDDVVDTNTYATRITDLIGVRALHLFKDQWRPIHDFLKSTWEFKEDPIAYYREGDPVAVVDAYTKSGCTAKVHPFGYRSIHYLIVTKPDRHETVVEVQVRTLFEEAWSEIDHRVRYPRLSEDPYLKDVLTILNRLAGSADEMGTLTKALAANVSGHKAELVKRERALQDKEAELKKVVSQLELTKEEKKELENRIDNLRWPWLPSDPSELLGLSSSTGSMLADLVTSPNYLDFLGSSDERFCAVCGARYTSSSPYIDFGRCPKCSEALSSATLTIEQLPKCERCGQHFIQVERYASDSTPKEQLCPTCQTLP